MVAISCKELSKRFGDIIAVNDITMQIKQGEIYGLIGRNGAGKTTFLKVIAGLAEKNIKYQFCASGFGKTAVSAKGEMLSNLRC